LQQPQLIKFCFTTTLPINSSTNQRYLYFSLTAD
jgi:hypothetical protein